MKKLLFVLPIVALLAAGCGSSKQANNQTPAAQTASLAPAPAQQPGNYLVIKEWGVEFEKPAGMDDLEYLLSENTADDGGVYFSTKQLMDLGKNFNAGKAYCGTDQAPLGYLGRTKNLPGPNDKYIPTNLKIGDYYYFSGGPQATCSGNKQVEALQTQQSNAVKIIIPKTLRVSVSAALESQIQSAVSQALAGSAITGYQPIPKGSKLLSAKVSINNSIAAITLDFNKAITANGQAAFEDTFKLVSNTIHPIVQGQGKDPKYAELQVTALIEGKPLNEVLP